MRPTKSAILALALVAFFSSVCVADTQQNPYLSVVDRNPFGLKTPPPPAPETAPQPVVPLAKVVLTGITSVFGPPRAFVEITEQEPGKTPNIKKPIMLIGDREGAIELISIDVANNSIRIKNGATETNIVFEVAKASSGPGPGTAGAVPTALPMGAPHPGQPGVAASANAPTIISSGGATPTGRAGTGVSLFGGTSPVVASSNPGAPNAAYPSLSSGYASAGNPYSGGAPAYAPGASSLNNLGGISTYGANNQNGQMPARPLRDVQAPRPNAADTLTRLNQAIRQRGLPSL